MSTSLTNERHEVGWIPGDDTFGARLALIRQHMGWGNVKDAADHCGIPVQSWRTWERDGRMPRDYLAICRRISNTVGVDYGWLVDGGRLARLPRLDSNQQPTGYLSENDRDRLMRLLDDHGFGEKIKNMTVRDAAAITNEQVPEELRLALAEEVSRRLLGSHGTGFNNRDDDEHMFHHPPEWRSTFRTGLPLDPEPGTDSGQPIVRKCLRP